MKKRKATAKKGRAQVREKRKTTRRSTPKKRTVKRDTVTRRTHTKTVRSHHIRGLYGRKTLAHETTFRFRRSSSIRTKDGSGKRAKQLQKDFERDVAPKVRRFVSNALKRRKGTFFFIRVKTNVNKRGKRVKSGISTRRVQLKSAKAVESYLKDLVLKVEATVKKYSREKSTRSITVTGLQMEVVKRATSSKTKKSKGRRSLER